MNINTGEIIRVEDIPNNDREQFIPLTSREETILKGMSRGKRKNWMKNKPCPCESGKKFKKCCFNKQVQT